MIESVSISRSRQFLYLRKDTPVSTGRPIPLELLRQQESA